MLTVEIKKLVVSHSIQKIPFIGHRNQIHDNNIRKT